MGLEQKLGNMGVVTTTLEQAVNWGRANAMWPMLFGLACCAIEMISTVMPDNDLSRFGMELMRASPRQSDLMIVAGRVSRKMAPVLRRLYDQMPDPKWVIAMGDCAACGGIFNNYAIVQGVDEVVPVDVYVAGCPPRPEALMHGIVTLHHKVEKEKLAAYAQRPPSPAAAGRAPRAAPALMFTRLAGQTAVDYWPDEPRFAVVYQLHSLEKGLTLRLLLHLTGDAPSGASVVEVFPSANWHEREVFDMFGIRFTGHPDLA